jgi:hypothetical protein
LGLGLEKCDAVAHQQPKITGLSRQILVKDSHPLPGTYMDSFATIK